MSEAKKTRLHAWHREQGAQMAVFGGYEMPLWYTAGAKAEHLAVLQGAGLFDTSHMAVVLVSGAESFQLLQECFSRDLEACLGASRPLAAGHCVYGVFLNRSGHLLDDALLYQLAGGSYMICVNAGMGATIAGHLERERAGREVTITDLSDRLGKLDLQGPAAAKIISDLLAEPEKVFEQFPYFTFKGHFDPVSPLATVRLHNQVPILLSRTGYTGEFGFEIFGLPEPMAELWLAILALAEKYPVLPCGLAARDSLRVGAMLPLAHQDIGDWPFCNNPWLQTLPYRADRQGFLKKFLGDQALIELEQCDYTYPYAGYDLRKVVVEEGEVLSVSGEAIGKVLTCVSEMALDRFEQRLVSITTPGLPESWRPQGLCCGFIRVKHPLRVGEAVLLRDKRRQLRVEIVADLRPQRTARRPLREMLAG